MTLTEFLLERIAEDEAAARDAAGWNLAGRERLTGEWCRDGINSLVDEVRREVVNGDGPAPMDAQVDHIARHDPARVLAECEAKRRIVEHCDYDHLALSPGDPYVLSLLALPYADHPEYRDEWSPDA